VRVRIKITVLGNAMKTFLVDRY